MEINISNIIREKIWQRKIALKIKLCSKDIRTEPVPSLLLEVRRNSYLPLYYTKIQIFFNDFTSKPEFSDIWLSFQDIPLKWNLPVGLLYDYLVGVTSNDYWELKLHMSDYPKTAGLKVYSVDDLGSYWMNQIKESTYIYNSSAKKMMNLSKENSHTLWQSAVDGDCGRYVSVFKKVINFQDAKNLPLKIYFPYTERDVIMREPVSPFTGSKPTTLGHILQSAMPELFTLQFTCKALSQGLELPLDTVLIEACDSLASLDGFLHIVVVV